MNKLFRICTLLIWLTTTSLVSCVDITDIVDPIEENNDFAPNSIVGKTIEFDSGNIKGYNFTSDGTCRYYFTGQTLSETPTYSYNKNSNTTAAYSVNYTMLRGSLKSATNSSFTLTFTSTNGGNYSGTSVIKISSTSTKNVSGKFTIY